MIQLFFIARTLGKINSNMMAGNNMTLSNMRLVIEEMQHHNEFINLVTPLVIEDINAGKPKEKHDDEHKPLLIEDECAPDAREYFEKDLVAMTGFTINDFREKGKKLDTDDMTVFYALDQYILESYADNQVYHLFKSQT